MCGRRNDLVISRPRHDHRRISRAHRQKNVTHPEQKERGALPLVVIVGAGFGGLETARKLRRAPVRVTVIDRRNHHLFQPLLYQVATAGLSPADIAVPVRSILRKHENVQVLMEEVVDVDTRARKLFTRSRTLRYDYLVIATGSQYSYFGHDDWRHLAPGLKSVEDATGIRSNILEAFEQAEMAGSDAVRRRLMTFVLVGAGPTGVEMAGAIAELARRALARDFRAIDPRSARIVLLEAESRVLPAFSETLAAYAHRTLKRMGVEVRCNTPVQEVRPGGVIAGGESIPSETVIWCAGVQAQPAGSWLSAETDQGGRVKVGPDLSIPDTPNVFVIGDAAYTLSKRGEPLPGLAAVAKQQGAFVADLIRHRARGDERAKRFRFRNYGELATIGRSAAVADFGWIRLRGWLAWVVWSLAHIYYLISFRNRLMVFMEWAWAYVTFGRGARLITGKPKWVKGGPQRLGLRASADPR